MFRPVTKAESLRLLDTSTRPESANGINGGPQTGYVNAYEHNKRLQNNRTAIESYRKVLTSPAVYTGVDAWMGLMQSATFRVEAANESPEAEAYANHIGACLGLGQAPALGIPWEVRLESLLMSCLYGFSVYELVCKQINGVWYTDMQSRDQASIAAFVLDEKEQLVGIEQAPVYGWSSSISMIPASRLLHIVHRPRGDTDYYGLGMLRACEPEYRDRVALSQSAISGAQRWALPTPVMQPDYALAQQMGLTPEQIASEIADAILVMKSYTGAERSYMFLPSWIKIDTFGGDVASPEKIDMMIDARDRRMLTTFLQQSLMLGSANAGGSYSLGETHVKMAEEHAASTLTRLSRQLSSYIARAIEWNFGSYDRTNLPTIRFDGLNSETFIQKLEVLSGLVSSGLLDKDQELKSELRRALEFKSEAPTLTASVTE